MANMSYCRFQNTLTDLKVCLAVLRDEEERRALSKEERLAAKHLLEEVSDFFTDMDLYDEEFESYAPIYELLYGDDEEEK